jgi:hypothetical protein
MLWRLRELRHPHTPEFRSARLAGDVELAWASTLGKGPRPKWLVSYLTTQR